jgi:uncharacterized protein YlxW (UPF0749 family)
VVTRQARRVRPIERPDASMSLITDLFAHPLDEGYREATDRRRAAGGPVSSGSGPRLSPALMGGVFALGLLLSIAAVQVRNDRGVVSAERESLVQRIEVADIHTDELENVLAEVERDIVELETDQLDNAAVGEELRDSVATLQGATGTAAVEGPGVVVEVHDAEAGEPGSTDVVLDVDIQQVVNGLWAAGAEAVSVNGERVTALTAIRMVNDVILVNFRPLNPPFEVQAIGDTRTLARRFLEGSGGSWLLTVAEDNGIQFDVRTEDSLTLPGASAVLRVAEHEEET